jgi:hypothetical protein
VDSNNGLDPAQIVVPILQALRKCPAPEHGDDIEQARNRGEGITTTHVVRTYDETF